MPISMNEKILLDSGKSIDSESMLQTIRDNGIKYVDVEGKYMKELIEAYPDFYKNKVESVQSARNSGSQRRNELSLFANKAKNLRPETPMITLVGPARTLVDVRPDLMRYFKIEKACSGLVEAGSSVTASKLCVLFVDDFQDDMLVRFRRDVLKTTPEMKFIAVHQQKCVFKIFQNTFYYKFQNTDLIKACYLSLYPEDFDKLDAPPVQRSFFVKVTRSAMNLIIDEGHEDEEDDFFEKIAELNVLVSRPSAPVVAPSATMTVVRLGNQDQAIGRVLQGLFKSGVKPATLVLVLDKITRDEVPLLKKCGLRGVALGGLNKDVLLDALSKEYGITREP